MTIIASTFDDSLLNHTRNTKSNFSKMALREIFLYYLIC